MSQGCGGCGSLQGSLDELRKDLDAKHGENRRAIERLEEEHDRTARELIELSGRIKPYLDNGQPGLVTKMSNKIDEVLEKVEQIRLEHAASEGAKHTVQFGLQHLIGPLIVGILLVIAQHYWK